uniref:Histone-lysine N-methyltransferase n=1 Tax=Cyclopterus lumpus TaxID=8103 RepID=A0A8C2ZN11_CYCLU
MAHSCRWRFPARPGGSCNSGTGRRAGRIRVTASLRSVSGAHPNAAGLGPGFDAALQVSSVIGSNLQKFRDVLGESSDSSSEEVSTGQDGGSPMKKPRGRPPRALTAQKVKPEGPERPAEKVKRLPGRPPGTGEKRRGRPPSSSSKKAWSTGSHAAGEDSRQTGSELGMETEEDKDKKGAKRTPLGCAQPHDTEAKLPKGGRGESKVTNLKRLRATKLAPLKSRLKTLPGVPRRRRGRPPSAERLKAEAAAAAAQLSASIECVEGKHNAFRVRGGDRGTEPHTPQQPMLRDVDGTEYQVSSDLPASPSPSKLGRTVGLRKSPRHRKPVRIVPSTKRTDATIAKQLLQRAKKGAQKRLEKEAVAIGGSGTGTIDSGIRKTQVKNIRQFIMPVVSTVSLRIIKTPKRFIEDEGNFGTQPPHMKIARLEPTPSSISTSAQPTSTSTISSSPSPVLVSSTPAVTSTGTAVQIDSLPPPPPPAPLPTVPSTAASMLNNNNTNNAANGRFSSSAASCGSSAVSQHSSQLSSAESSRSSSPSLDDSSCDSQASEATHALSEPEDHSPSSQGEREANLLHSSRPPSPPSEPEPEHVLAERSRRGRRGQGVGRGNPSQRVRETLTTGAKKPIISPPTGVIMSSSTLVNSQHASSTASSSSSPPPPPLLTPPQPPQSASSNTAAISEHHSQSPWITHPIPPFLSGPSVLSSLSDKRSRSILREPTFRWTSLSHPEQQYFSSAKYAKEGLIRKPVFDNFRPPPLTAEDVGLLPHGVSGAGGAAPVVFPAPGSGAGTGTRLFSPLHPHSHHQHPSSSRFDAPHQKRSPLLRAPRFTPSEAHSRIFESVTLHSSSGSSPGSLSPHQTSSSSNRTSRRRRRLVLGILRGHPRSPSHSMTRRSSQIGGPMLMGKGSSEMSALTGSVPCSNPSSLPGVSASPLATSALTPPFSTFSTVSMGLAPQGTPDSRRAAAGNPPPLSTTSATSGTLFPHFPSSAQDTGRGAGKGGKEKTLSAPQEPAQKEKERDSEKNREKEKENKREGRKDLEKRSKVSTPDDSPNAPSSLFTVDGRDSEDALLSIAPKKVPGRKKSTSVETISDTASSEVRGAHSTVPLSIAKGRLSKKNRPSEKGAEIDDGEKEKEKQSAPSQQTTSLPGQPGRQQLPVSSLGSMLAQAEKQPVTDKRVVGLLKKAKAQLFEIKKSKLKPAEQTKGQGQESDSSEASVRGPRIKHVCRRAAVALGRNRAVFPDDMPTLSALPWEEREKILSSMGNDDKSSVAGSEEAEPQSPPSKPRETRQKAVQEAPPKKGRRSRRCSQCPGCQVPEDCGVCTNCLDKPKFGGRNIKKQCCKMRKCQNLQWMPSKMFLQKQGKCKKDKKKNKLSEKKEGFILVKGLVSESGPKPPSAPLKEEPVRKKSETPELKLGEEKSRLQPLSKQSSPALASSPASVEPLHAPSTAQAHSPALTPDAKPLSVTSSVTTQNSPSQSTQSHQPSHQQHRPLTSQAPSKKDASPKISLSEPKKKPLQQSSQQQSSTTTVSDIGTKNWAHTCIKPLTTKPPSSSTLNWLSTPSTRGQAKSRAPCDGVHRIRVDFKRDLDVEKVWEAGGLSLLTSVPVTPRVLCFLCASSGNVEFVFCQVCCEPFHLFCLGESERPLQEQFENWCCRRCRFCQACGRQHQKTKQLLECDKCRNSYHPECLGPNHPTRPTKKKRVWVCTKCVRCKSCGATKPGKSWDAQWSHDFSMCHDCAKLFAKGNFCPLCDKCYDDDDYDSKMMECGRCNHWVHAKCENLTDEMYELLSKLPESVAYTCTKCTERHPAEWRTALERELQGCVRHVLTALLNSRTSSHLLRYKQAVKPPQLNPETEESLPSRRSPEGPDPPVLTEVTSAPPSDSPPDLESVDKKMDHGRYNSVLEFSDDITRIIQTAINSDGGQPESRKANSMVKSFFIRQMDRIFPWFKVKESRLWERQKVSANSGLLPNAVLPPSLDHNYAQWQERQELSRAELPHLMKKIIPAPQPKTPGEPDSPASPPPLPPSLPPPPPLLPDRDDSPELPPPPGICDNRKCVLCLKYGDENTNEGGRLLYIGQNEWTHVNCALWSAEVFEDDDGSLKNVHMAVLRGKQLRCEKCQKPGATVGCCLTSCTSNYHFMCARQCHCVFLEDKKVYCPKHRDLIKGEVVSGFEVTRRILVDLEGIRLRRKWLAGLEPENVHMMIGSMTIECLGILTELSDCKRKLFPVGYQCSRVYWSTLDARKRCVYTCRILVCHPLVVESDLKNMMAPEENRTIAHSPPSIADPFESPRRSDTLSPANTPKLRKLISLIVTVGDSLVNPGMRNIDSRRHSSPSLSPPPHQLNRLRVFTSPPQVLSRPLTSPPPLIPSPARDPEKSKHLSKESNRLSRELGQKESDKNEISAKEPEKRRPLSKDSGLKESERRQPPSRDSEKGRQLNKDSEKGRQTSRDSSNSVKDKNKSSSKNPNYKDIEKARSLSRDAGLRDSEKQRQHCRETRETGKDLGQVHTLIFDYCLEQRIGQLDGVDDGSESDTSICTTSTTTTTATSSSTPHKSTPKRRGRERHPEKPDSHDSSKEAENSGGAVSGNTREGRKNQKENCLPLGGGVKSQPQSQGQDPLEAQLSLSTDLLKSDSDNNNSDDCGNILPSDIMEFVLNTPSMSMQALGQQSEPSSSELLLDDGYVGVDVNRPKDILFDDFSQQLPSAESGAVVESSVNSSISVEEPYLPLELPSDLSVLTTRSPSVNTSQNHTAVSLISDTSDRTMLGLAPDPEMIRGEKNGDKKRAGPGVSPSQNHHDATTLGNRDAQVTEGHMTPEQFIPSPAIGQVVEPPGNQGVPRSSGTPGLPNSPSLPLQVQKYIPAPAAAAGSPSTVPGPGPSQTQVSSPAVIKPAPDKLIVVNQQFQPLYVLQTVPNGVAQNISAGVMDRLNTTLSTAQSIFPAGGKVMGTMAHPSQIHSFKGTTHTGFQTGLPSTTSGLLIGLPHDQPQILVSEAGRPRELGPGVAIVSCPSSQTVLASAHGKKRPISRLQPRKSKKLARTRRQPTLAPSEVGPSNMTLINLSSPQITASIPGQPGGLVELSSLSTSQRKVPNIIKRPKSGRVMYLDPTTLLQQRIPGIAQPGILGHDSSTHLIPCTVSGLNPSQSVLNVVSVPTSGATGLLAPGSVSLSTPLLGSTEITGPIGNLLFKASPHGLGLQSAGAPLISHLSSSVQTSIASSICILPSQQTISMAVNQHGETEISNIHLQHQSQHGNRAPSVDSSPNTTVTLATSLSSAKRRVVGVFTQTQTSTHSHSSRTTPISRSSEQRPPNSTTLGAEKGKPKSKRSRQSPDITTVKKLKASQAEEHQTSLIVFASSSKELSSPEPMDTGKPADKATNKRYGVIHARGPVLPGKDKPSAAGGAGSLTVPSPPGQDGNSRDTGLDSKPKKGIIFEICSEDGFHIRCESIEEAWKSLTDKVQEARSNARLKELSFEGVNGLRMLGVVHEAVVFLLEQLYGSRHCRSYRFRFHKPEETDEPPINPHGSVRAEIHHRRSVFDMFNFLASKHRQPPEYRPQEDDDDEGQLRTARRASMELPLAVRFKQLKATSKETVGVYRSPIHGRGLFCKKTIDAGEMVIEYSGNVIRSVLTDKREKYYDGKGIGCYMFRIDDYEVVDATVHGNAARFINHSCEPNCYSRVITVDGQKHIVILASRRIYCGEELTYDYKFPIEDASNKLPCNCGAKKCRKSLN